MLPPINETVNPPQVDDQLIEQISTADQTTLVANEEEAFVLEPLDATGKLTLKKAWFFLSKIYLT